LNDTLGVHQRGDQAIRPAAVNRKVWGGNRTWRGPGIQSRIMSIIQLVGTPDPGAISLFG
jgi:hypothetical protein